MIPGKRASIEDIMIRRRINITYLQETTWVEKKSRTIEIREIKKNKKR